MTTHSKIFIGFLILIIAGLLFSKIEPDRYTGRIETWNTFKDSSGEKFYVSFGENENNSSCRAYSVYTGKIEINPFSTNCYELAN